MNKNIVVFLVTGTFALLLMALFAVSFIFFYHRRRRELLQEKQLLAESYQREILHSQLEMQNHTLQQVSRELHDHIGQMLSLTMLQLGVLEEKLHQSPLQENVKQVVETVERTMKDVRSLTKALDSHTVERFGLEESLLLETKRIQNTGRFQTQFHVSGTPYPLGEQTEIFLFRMAQESLNNAMKHSGGRTLIVRIDFQPYAFTLTVTDDGYGFDVTSLDERSPEESGSGLHHLRQRARLLGGECKVFSQPGAGTQVEIQLPHPDHQPINQR